MAVPRRAKSRLKREPREDELEWFIDRNPAPTTGSRRRFSHGSLRTNMAIATALTMAEVYTILRARLLTERVVKSA